MPARVIALHLKRKRSEPMEAVGRVTARAHHGLEGDRHARANQPRSVLLMRSEDLADLGLEPGDVREQVTVADFDLYGPPRGARFKVGSSVLELGGPCAPCEFMDGLKPGLRRESEGRRGRFAIVVADGSFAVGDAITPAPPA